MSFWNGRLKIGFLCLIFVVMLPTASCTNTMLPLSTQQGINFPEWQDWSSVTTMSGREWATFGFHVKQYRYAVNNESQIVPDLATPPKHCSQLILAGLQNGHAAWLRVVARPAIGSPLCEPLNEFCLKDKSNTFWGQMIVEQSELDTLHARLVNRQLPGEFIATCITERGISKDPVAVRTEVRFTGWN